MTKRFCPAPWHGLHINPRGDIKTCCAGNPNMTGNISNMDVGIVLNGTNLTQVRKLMKEGIFHPVYCSNCLNGGNEWEWHANVNEHFDYANAPDGYLYPTIFDARWNTTCNQSCNYCDSNNSSSWAALVGHPFKPETRKHTDSVFDLIEQNRDKLKEVALVGGEPLLLKENISVLDSVANTDCKVVIITNLNVDLESNRIFQKLKEHHTVGWSLSFDNIGDRYNYVRYGGSWELHTKNISILKELMNDPSKRHDGGIHAVYNIYNCTRLIEFKEWAIDNNLTILWQRSFAPLVTAPYSQNDKIRQLAIDEIDKYLDTFDLEQSEIDFHQQSRELLLNGKLDADFLQFTNQIENEYHPDTKGEFERLWPEIYQALGPI